MVWGLRHGDLACRSVHEDIVRWLHIDDQGWQWERAEKTTVRWYGLDLSTRPERITYKRSGPGVFLTGQGSQR